MVLLQAVSQTLGQEAASGAWVTTNEPSGHAHPHSTGGGGAGLPPRAAIELETGAKLLRPKPRWANF
jgi:hypothetical protein